MFGSESPTARDGREVESRRREEVEGRRVGDRIDPVDLEVV